jgi:hypothetical protein
MKRYLEDMGYEDDEWIELAQDRVQWSLVLHVVDWVLSPETDC